MDLEFEWDEEKRITNVKERGVDFRDAALIFVGPVVTKEDMLNGSKSKAAAI